MINLLTFDLEDWFHGNFIFDQDDNVEKDSRVVEPTLRILKILEDTGSQATFFVLGSVAEKYPDLIKKIHDQGHEIGSHGYHHKLVYQQSRKNFSADVGRCIGILQQITNDKIIGYRAPYRSIYSNRSWAFEVLRESGIEYDSSVYPFKTYLYGENKVPRFKYLINGKTKDELLEIPPSVLEILYRRVPFCGGFYFRLFPYWFVKWGIKRINRIEHQPAVFYLHPYEIDIKKTKNSKGLKNNFILHVNVKKAEKKLKKLLTDFRFISIKAYLTELQN